MCIYTHTSDASTLPLYLQKTDKDFHIIDTSKDFIVFNMYLLFFNEKQIKFQSYLL